MVNDYKYALTWTRNQTRSLGTCVSAHVTTLAQSLKDTGVSSVWSLHGMPPGKH